MKFKTTLSPLRIALVFPLRRIISLGGIHTPSSTRISVSTFPNSLKTQFAISRPERTALSLVLIIPKDM